MVIQCSSLDGEALNQHCRELGCTLIMSINGSKTLLVVARRKWQAKRHRMSVRRPPLRLPLAALSSESKPRLVYVSSSTSSHKLRVKLAAIRELSTGLHDMEQIDCSARSVSSASLMAHGS